MWGAGEHGQKPDLVGSTARWPLLRTTGHVVSVHVGQAGRTQLW